MVAAFSLVLVVVEVLRTPLVVVIIMSKCQVPSQGGFFGDWPRDVAGQDVWRARVRGA